MTLPPGQVARGDFPRFGLPDYARRFPSRPVDRQLILGLPDLSDFTVDDALAELPRTTVKSDFHCVTTWSCRQLEWSGVSFKDFFDRFIVPRVTDATLIAGAVLTAQDGYRTSLLLDDLLQDDVLLADELEGQPLSIEHGAPLRLVAPAHYGYKNPKHLTRVDFHTAMPVIKRGVRAFLDHPRARVSLEERGRWVPGWILRRLYRPLVGNTVKQFRDAMREFERSSNDRSS